MEKKFIGLGITTGLIAGAVSFGYVRTRISPLIDAAIDYEDGRSHAEDLMSGEHGHGHELFSRALQENVGAGAGTLLFGVVMGALFAVAFVVLLAALRRRGMTVNVQGAAIALAFSAFVTTTLVPALAYPPNPPGVGLEETIGERTTTYLATVIISVALASGAAAVGLRFAPRVGGWTTATTAAIGYLVAMAAVVAALPSYHEVPGPLVEASGAVLFPGFPAEVLSDFRIGSLVSQALLWAVIGAFFAVGLARLTRTRSTNARPEAVHAAR